MKLIYSETKSFEYTVIHTIQHIRLKYLTEYKNLSETVSISEYRTDFPKFKISLSILEFQKFLLLVKFVSVKIL